MKYADIRDRLTEDGLGLNTSAYPKSLEDSVNVNDRRKSIGLEPIEEYFNLMTEMHFEMNKEILEIAICKWTFATRGI